MAGPLALPAMSFGAADAERARRAASGGLEEIVVTATRRTERLQDVPISVMAFSQEKMDAAGAQEHRRPVASFARRELPAQRHELGRQLQ